MLNKVLLEEELKNMNMDRRLNKADLETLIDIIEKNIESDVNISELADKIIFDLFGTFGTEPFVPWSFFETELGKAILLAKFKINNKIYFVSDIIELTGYSRQYIGKEMKNGNISFKKRHGTIYFTESEVNRYIKKKKAKNEKI